MCTSLTKHSKKRRLQHHATTRFLSYAYVIEGFLVLFEPVINALEKLSDKESIFDAKTKSESENLLAKILKFQFLITCEIMFYILNVTKPYNEYIQNSSLNLFQFQNVTNCVFEALINSKSDLKFKKIYNLATERCKKLNIDVPDIVKPPGRSSKAVDSFSFYKENLYFNTLDQLIFQFETRIVGKNIEIISAMGIFQKNFLLDEEEDEDLLRKHIDTLTKFYGDIEISSNCEVILSEHHNFKNWLKKNIVFSLSDTSSADFITNIEKLTNEYENFNFDDEEAINIPELASIKIFFIDLLKILSLVYSSNLTSSFPNMTKLIELALTFPLTSNTAERSFSLLKLIKMQLRSTMSQDRLNSLAIIKMNSDIIIEIDKIIDKFASLKNRRMDLLFE